MIQTTQIRIFPILLHYFAFKLTKNSIYIYANPTIFRLQQLYTEESLMNNLIYIYITYTLYYCCILIIISMKRYLENIDIFIKVTPFQLEKEINTIPRNAGKLSRFFSRFLIEARSIYPLAKRIIFRSLLCL